MINNSLKEHRWDDMDLVKENVSVSPKHPPYCSYLQWERRPVRVSQQSGQGAALEAERRPEG